MRKIETAEGIILFKSDFGDSSKIITIYTKEFGKIKGIVKGVKSGKSKIGGIVDTLNLVRIVFYPKETGEIYLISQVELIKYYPQIKSDIDKIKYAIGITELIQKLLNENEKDDLFYRAIIRILDLLENEIEFNEAIFLKFFLFYIDHLGYEMNFEKCYYCGTAIELREDLKYNPMHGAICKQCYKSNNSTSLVSLNSELYEILLCLNRKDCYIKISGINFNKILAFLEKYLNYHFEEFDKIKSLRIY